MPDTPQVPTPGAGGFCHARNDFLLQALETAPPHRIETLLYLADKEHTAFAHSPTEPSSPLAHLLGSGKSVPISGASQSSGTGLEGTA